MPELILYPSFTKRPNSTKLPDVSPFRFDVRIKDRGADRRSLTLLLSQPYDTTYTYAKFMDAYYYVDVSSYSNPLSELELTEDVLATYRDEIMATSNYCIRSSAASNGKIVDNLQPTEFSRYLINTEANFLEAFSPDQGYTIINVYGKSGTNCFLIDSSGVDSICNNLFSQKQSDLWETIKGALAGQITQMINLTGYINDLYVLPFNPAAGGSRNIYLGFFDTGVQGRSVQAICKQDTVTISVPHPNNDEPGDSKYYLRSSKYVSYMLYIPCCGTYAIDADYLADTDVLYFSYVVDSYGNITGHLATDSLVPFLYISGSCAYRYAIGQQQSMTYAQVASQAVGSAITFNAGGVESALANAVPTAGTVIGGSGNAAAWRLRNGKITLTMYWREPAGGLPYGMIGYPVYRSLKPSAPGYYEFKNAHVAADEAWESEKIEQYLNTGIFIE